MRVSKKQQLKLMESLGNIWNNQNTNINELELHFDMKIHNLFDFSESFPKLLINHIHDDHMITVIKNLFSSSFSWLLLIISFFLLKKLIPAFKALKRGRGDLALRLNLFVQTIALFCCYNRRKKK